MIVFNCKHRVDTLQKVYTVYSIHTAILRICITDCVWLPGGLVKVIVKVSNLWMHIGRFSAVTNLERHKFGTPKLRLGRFGFIPA